MSARLTDRVLHARWLGRVPYDEALALQRAIHARSDADYLLLLEHPAHLHARQAGRPGARARAIRRRWAPDSCTTDRGRRRHLPRSRASSSATRSVHSRRRRPAVATSWRTSAGIEAALIEALGEFGITGERVDGRSGVWVGGDEDRRDRRAGRAAIARCTGSRSTSIPTSRCSTTSSRAGSRDAGVTSMAAVLGARAATRGPPYADAVVARAWAALTPARSWWSAPTSPPGGRCSRPGRRPRSAGPSG